MLKAQPAVVEEIARAVRERRYRLTLHAEAERDADGLSVSDIEEAFGRLVEILEDYPEDRRGHSCLVLGFTQQGLPVHGVVGALSGPWIVFITVYQPDSKRWENHRRRKTV